ncbi:hypothetical protein SAMD00019534_080410 [Acytostelium subglobosum LB1]|uniref:hypothetical protein n=1 Tax=Acytostelium subglobosum LB1 TaxID=1410327 RepID=UPI000644CBDD|nr:hypothetical protein SAMD00019534_080410 [Acytostelium subglobosum LB1]GAM24866.1 hypothetical protein SAMD00019534_080410 [Acytostelium subglobosum LB1]|eukprot:XP_012751955.1 hypothetical protein SAMD00019534_080410 [Acytostelium subglobosum LB1]
MALYLMTTEATNAITALDKKQLNMVIMSVNEKSAGIELLKTEKKASLDELLAELPENECRFIIYSWEHMRKDVKTVKDFFFRWTPNGAPEQQKLRYKEAESSLQYKLSSKFNRVARSKADFSDEELRKIGAW